LRKLNIDVCYFTPFFTPSYTSYTMAYNREWDQGKDAWNNYANAWAGGSSSGAGVRPREDDYYGEGKRRKYNDGVCLTQGNAIYLCSRFRRVLKVTIRHKPTKSKDMVVVKPQALTPRMTNEAAGAPPAASRNE
jgi:hypothetical protein